MLILLAALYFIPGIQDHALSASEVVFYVILGVVLLVLFLENLFYKFRRISLNKLSIVFKGKEI